MPDPQAPDGGPTLDRPTIDTLARSLLDAEHAARPVAPLTDRYAGMTVADAYAIQQQYARLRTGAGARLVGHKIGATSKAIQEQLGVDVPDYGHLFADMRHDEDEPIPIDQLVQPLTESEIAFVLAEDLSGPGVTPEDVMAAARGVVPCLEIIDSRIEGWRIRLADTVADNGSSARFVVGRDVLPVAGLDLAREQVTLARNGEVVARGEGSAVLGHPAASAAWLVNALAAFGESLSAGAYVLSGSLTNAVPARPGDRFVADFSHIGSVGCVFTGAGDAAR